METHTCLLSTYICKASVQCQYQHHHYRLNPVCVMSLKSHAESQQLFRRDLKRSLDMKTVEHKVFSTRFPPCFQQTDSNATHSLPCLRERNERSCTRWRYANLFPVQVKQSLQMRNVDARISVSMRSPEDVLNQQRPSAEQRSLTARVARSHITSSVRSPVGNIAQAGD